ncbi:MAG: hypothetical protein E7624_03470 [Ruminococcaceae bacterium]|nr:hypothetical protein [Oscillospiraceae bacterium]
MTKIRTVSLLLCFVLLLMSFVGCQEEYQGEYVALEVGGTDSQFAIWSSEKLNYHQASQAPKTATVTFNGRTYSGSYKNSCVNMPDLYVSHRYKCEDTWFKVDDDAKELLHISFFYDYAGGKKSQVDCKKIADAIADDYISLSEYKVGVEVIEHPLCYIFTYYREVSTYRTTDGLSISIDGNGRIRSFTKRAIGSFEDIESVPIDEKKAQDTIEAKLDAIYQGNTKRKGHEILDVILIKLEDDTCALLYTIENRFEDENVSYGSLTKLLLKTFQKGKEK